MDRKLRLVTIVFAAVAAGLAARELGGVELGFYEWDAQSSQTASRRGELPEAKPSVNLTFYVDDEERDLRRYAFEGDRSLPIDVRIETRLEGSPWVPLFKNLRFTYSALTLLPEPDVLWEVKGEIRVTIQGPCSAHEARERLRRAALDGVRDYLHGELMR